MSPRTVPKRAAPKRAATRPRSSGAPEPGLDRLWAPWRMAWLRKASGPHRCLFCRVARGPVLRTGSPADRRDLVLARRGHALLMINRYPYASGHLMVAVRRHAARFVELTATERVDVLDLVSLAERALEVEYKPHGVNYGVNVGRVAGAGFPGHLHLHLVPRWEGDTNFMPAVGLTRVLPESLADTWSRLRRVIATLERPTRARPAKKGGPRGAQGR